MATMQIISVLASLLLLSSAAPKYRRFVLPEPVSEHPAFSTTEEPWHYPTTTEDYTAPDNGNSERRSEIISCDASLNQALTVIADSTVYSFSAGFSTDGNSTDNYYSNNQRCTITFVTTESRMFEIFVFRLQLEYHSMCQYDSLCLGGTKICSNWPDYGNGIFRYPVPAGQTFTIDFKTDSSVTYRGFLMGISNFPYNFTSAYYTRTAEYATSPYDFTYSYISPEDYVDTCGQYNSDQTTDSYYNTDNDFSYHSTEDYQYTTTNPFDAGAKIVRCDGSTSDNWYPLYGSTSTDRIYNANSDQLFIFKSPNYGRGFYNNNQRCTLSLYTSDTPYEIQIYYVDFDVENATGCPFDKVCVNGVKYCGDWMTGNYQYYKIPAYSTFTVYFLTDSSVAKRGFHIRITTTGHRFSDPIYQVTGGDGSSPNSVSYDYIDGSNYVDKCSNNYDTSSYPSDQPSTPYYDTDSPVYDPYPEDGEVPF